MRTRRRVYSELGREEEFTANWGTYRDVGGGGQALHLRCQQTRLPSLHRRLYHCHFIRILFTDNIVSIILLY